MKKIVITIATLLAVAGIASCAPVSSTTRSSAHSETFCETTRTAPYRGAASNDDLKKYMAVCR